ncbi:MAG: Phosphoenolpyruvate-protein phosphotransferase [Chlamydiales bacterium]|nr:Phosphoenolpyruvate-protein phosphotransferase [Chlamydiales bacterium]MCH9619943.1 Phosphoenolpyruvate-protein phosphotransferase [Chlamydiales bacterium]MCH9622630.1 Phosphoenolpyruvate-protein phosphotransferase [Chlamydiales bacterium]
MSEKERYFRGYPICPGIAIGKPFFFSVVDEKVPEFSVSKDEVEEEVARYYVALKNSRKDLLVMQHRLQKEGGSEAVAILHSHLEMMRDPLMTESIEKEIREKKKNTEYVFKMVMGEYEKKFAKITDTFFQERLKDVQDISRRIFTHLRRDQTPTLANIGSSSIIFAHELAPSDTAEANAEQIVAFVTRSGSETSHVAIMARAKGIPFVSKVDFPDLSTMLPKEVIVDGSTGDIILNPTPQTLEHFRKKKKKLKVEAKGLRKSGFFEAETIDGHKVHLSANIEAFSEVETLLQNGGEGVGLFRSEYLFLARDSFPSEEEQFEGYRLLVEKVHGHPSVIRTFDIGGDKLGNFYPTPYEKNPNLGCRAIRLMLKERGVFKAQLRAILRASAFGEVRILFPMISGVLELREAKEVVEEAKAELHSEGIPFERNIPIGCMIETPSAAMTTDILAKECDFLSIGTNDLVQYALAVDRGNPEMSYLYKPTHPSIIRMIKMIAQEGSRAKIPVTVCGEIAANPRFTPLLLGLGVQELSVSSVLLPVIKDVVRHLSIVEATEFADHILSLSTALEVEEALETRE